MIHENHKFTWIASFPRSGNTWVRAFITTYINNGVGDINSIMQTGDKDPNYYDGIIKTPIREWSLKEQSLVKPAAMLRMLEDANGNLMLKTHDCNIDLYGVAQIPHDLTRAAIYMVRDPRDIALSFNNHFNTETMEIAVDRMIDNNYLTRFPDYGLIVPQLSWKTHIQSWMRELPYPVYTLRYEDLLVKPFEIFGEVVKFLKLDYDKDLLQKSIDACSFERFSRQEEETEFRESVGQTFFHKGKAGLWKTELGDVLEKKIITACKREMQSLGYLD